MPDKCAAVITNTQETTTTTKYYYYFFHFFFISELKENTTKTKRKITDLMHFVLHLYTHIHTHTRKAHLIILHIVKHLRYLYKYLNRKM